VRDDHRNGSSEGSVSNSYGRNHGPTYEMSEKVGIYADGRKSLPRPRNSRRPVQGLRMQKKAIGLLVVLAAAIFVVSAVALAPSSERAKAPTVPAQTDRTPHLSFVGPTASFTYTVNNMLVSVDATSSSDPDGTITSYDWTFGDGGTGTGVTASHTYTIWGDYWIVLTVTDSNSMTSTMSQQVTVPGGIIPPLPYTLWGYVTDSGGNPVFGCNVSITDLRTGFVWYNDTDYAYGYYTVDLNTNVSGWQIGDIISVTANTGSMTGTNTGDTGLPGNEASTQVDVQLTTAIPEFPSVLLPVLGMVVLVAVMELRRRQDH